MQASWGRVMAIVRLVRGGGARGLGQTPALKSKSESTTRHFKRMQNASKQ